MQKILLSDVDPTLKKIGSLTANESNRKKCKINQVARAIIHTILAHSIEPAITNLWLQTVTIMRSEGTLSQVAPMSYLGGIRGKNMELAGFVI